MTDERSKFILTVEVPTRSATVAGEILLRVAKTFRASRLTRSDWEDADSAGRLREVRRRTIHH